MLYGTFPRPKCVTLKDFQKDFNPCIKPFSSRCKHVSLMIPLMSIMEKNHNECQNFYFHIFHFISVPLHSCPNYAWEIKKSSERHWLGLRLHFFLVASISFMRTPTLGCRHVAESASLTFLVHRCSRVVTHKSFAFHKKGSWIEPEWIISFPF